MKELLHNNGYEYIDFCQFGVDDSIMKKAGFLLKNEIEGLIVPAYFEPFEQSNVALNFFTTQKEYFRAFKADGDQDRPNIINNQ